MHSTTGVRMGIVEAGERQTFEAGEISNPVRSRDETVVGPSREKIADVDHEGAGFGRGGVPGA